MFRTIAEWYLLFFAKFRSHRVKNKKVMTRTSSQLNAPVLMTEPFNLGKRLRNERRNSIPVTLHYPGLGRAGSNGWKFASSNQKHYPDLGCDSSSAWNFSARFSDVISRRNGDVSKCWLFHRAELGCGPQEFNSREIHQQLSRNNRVWNHPVVTSLSIGWFSNRTGTSVDDSVRKSNNWLAFWPMAERQIGHWKSSLVVFARFPVVKWRSCSVAKSA